MTSAACAFPRVQFGTIDIGAFERGALPNGDFDADGEFECDDIDALVAALAADLYSVDLDLDGDATLDDADLGLWLAIAGAANLPSGQPYLRGDANLDGFVDGSDFILWNQHKFTPSASWCQGDFNADGFVDGADFVLWNAHKFQSFAVVSASLPTKNKPFEQPGNDPSHPTQTQPSPIAIPLRFTTRDAGNAYIKTTSGLRDSAQSSDQYTRLVPSDDFFDIRSV